MDQRFCKTCERFVDLDDLQIVTESNRIIVAFDKKRGIAHDLISAAATKSRLAKIGKVKGEVITVRKPGSVPEPAAPGPVIETPAPAVIKKAYQLLGTVRSELSPAGFTIIDADDGLEYLLRGDGIIPDINGLRALSAGERVIFSPFQHFKKNIAKEVVPVSRANEPMFSPSFKDWYSLNIEIHDLDKGFAMGHLVGTDIKVFVSSRTVLRQSTYTQAFRDVKVGDTLAVRIKPSDEVAHKFETIVAMIEDVPEETESATATFGDLYAQPGDKEYL
jgi:hypothetical protein